VIKPSNIFYRITLITTLVLSCTKPVPETEPVLDIPVHDTQIEIAPDTQLPAARYEGIGLRLHTMIGWTDDAHTLWRRVNSGCYDDIIIEMPDKKDTNGPDRYQYLIFDYVQKEVVDIIAVDDSYGPLVFYKSRLPDTLLMENYDGSRRFKYVYGKGVSVIEDTEFMGLIKGKYFSEAPQSEAYTVNYERHAVIVPPVVYYTVDTSILPEAWPDGLNADYKLLNRLNAGVFNFSKSGYKDTGVSGYENGISSYKHINIRRTTDWKIWDNRYVFMLHSDPNSNPYEYRLYYVVRTLDGKLVFTIPRITAPVLKYEADPLNSAHDTFIDFSADQKRVLIKGMINNKLCVMIYDIVTYEEWTLANNTTAERLTFGASLISPLETVESISADRYGVEPGTTTLRGVIGKISGPVKKRERVSLPRNVIVDVDVEKEAALGNLRGGITPLYEEPDEKSNIIMQLSLDSMDRYKHDNKHDYSVENEEMVAEILNRTEAKTSVNGVEDYWYQIIFDSAINWEREKDWKWKSNYIDKIRGSIRFTPEMLAEYSGWVWGGNIKILDTINENVIILSEPREE